MMGSVPKAIPPCLTLGHDILISYPQTSRHSSRRLSTARYSSSVDPATFGMMAQGNFDKKGIFSLINRSTPTLARPIELSMPDGVSTIRGISFPGRGFRVTALVNKAPMTEKSMSFSYSLP